MASKNRLVYERRNIQNIVGEAKLASNDKTVVLDIRSRLLLATINRAKHTILHE